MSKKLINCIMEALEISYNEAFKLPAYNTKTSYMFSIAYGLVELTNKTWKPVSSDFFMDFIKGDLGDIEIIPYLPLYNGVYYSFIGEVSDVIIGELIWKASVDDILRYKRGIVFANTDLASKKIDAFREQINKELVSAVSLKA